MFLHLDDTHWNLRLAWYSHMENIINSDLTKVEMFALILDYEELEGIKGLIQGSLDLRNLVTQGQV